MFTITMNEVKIWPLIPGKRFINSGEVSKLFFFFFHIFFPYGAVTGLQCNEFLSSFHKE